MYNQNPNRTVKKISDPKSNFKDTFKFQEDREKRIKKEIFNFIQNNAVEIISDDQLYYEGKNQLIHDFAGKIKFHFESKDKNLPIMTIPEYVAIIRNLNAEQHKFQELSSTNYYSKYLDEEQITSLVRSEKLVFSKSLEQAEEFLQHILFRVPEGNSTFVKVVTKRIYNVIDSTGQHHQIEKEIMIPGFKTIKDYEETLSNIPVKKNINEKQESYWDVYSRSKAVVQASMVYNPYQELYWYDEFKHYYVNSYIEPAWKEEPGFFHLMDRHQRNPMTFDKLSDLLRSFLIHLFPDKNVRREVLKWCAFSTTEKLQTYLTLIGPQGIGKNLLIDEFLGYYHGEDNLNKPKRLDMQFNAKCANSTLLYFDEKIMGSLEEYNEMKTYINKKIQYEEKNKPVYMGQNFANIVWSCNTKDTMNGMSRDDRRFKVVPITSEKLFGAPIYNEKDEVIGRFTPDIVAAFSTSEVAKKEFVLLMFAIRDHVENSKEGKTDINTISDNEARDAILSESRSPEFTAITDVLKNVHNDFNELTNRFGNKPMSQQERESLGEIYEDYIPLSKLMLPTRENYTYRVPYAVIRKVMNVKETKQRKLSQRAFNKHLDNMPEKFMRGIVTRGQERDIEIRLEGEEHYKFIEELKPYLDPAKRKAKVKTNEVKGDEEDPFS